MTEELEKFDWFHFVSTAPKTSFMPDIISVIGVHNETPYDRKLRMLRQLSNTCLACSMCSLGQCGAKRNDTVRDPHVLSNMNPTRYMVVGQGPGWTELEKREPFVGAAGKNFDAEIAKHGLDRSWFYITNTIRCFVPDNAKPDKKSIARCEPFLQIEFNLIKPFLVITLGAVAFEQLCPDADFAAALGNITKSTKYGVSVYSIYHPSPLNLADSSRREAFAAQIKKMCLLVKALKKRHGDL